MPKPDFQEIIIQVYNKELADREVIFNRSNLIVTINMASITGAAYLAKTIDFDLNMALAVCVIVVLVVWAITTFMSIVYTRKALTGFQYEEMPKAESFIKYYKESIKYKQELEAYNATNNTNHAVPDPQEYTNDYMLDAIASACDANHKTNQKRRDILRRALAFVSWSIPLLFVAALVFICFDLDSSSPRKDNGVYDKNLTAAVHEISSALNNLPKEICMATNAPAPSPSTTSNAPAVSSQSSTSQQAPLPTPPKRESNQIALESYDKPFSRPILTEQKK